MFVSVLGCGVLFHRVWSVSRILRLLLNRLLNLKYRNIWEGRAGRGLADRWNSVMEAIM